VGGPVEVLGRLALLVLDLRHGSTAGFAGKPLAYQLDDPAATRRVVCSLQSCSVIAPRLRSVASARSAALVPAYKPGSCTALADRRSLPKRSTSRSSTRSRERRMAIRSVPATVETVWKNAAQSLALSSQASQRASNSSWGLEHLGATVRSDCEPPGPGRRSAFAGSRGVTPRPRACRAGPWCSTSP
jgi:hypothetical protein